MNRWTHSFGIKNQCDLPQVASLDPLESTLTPTETTTETQDQDTESQAETETADEAQKKLREVTLFQFLVFKFS